jgi:hypothetical protein
MIDMYVVGQDIIRNKTFVQILISNGIVKAKKRERIFDDEQISIRDIHGKEHILNPRDIILMDEDRIFLIDYNREKIVFINEFDSSQVRECDAAREREHHEGIQLLEQRLPKKYQVFDWKDI